MISLCNYVKNQGICAKSLQVVAYYMVELSSRRDENKLQQEAWPPQLPSFQPPFPVLFLHSSAPSETDLFCLDSDEECGLNEL